MSGKGCEVNTGDLWGETGVHAVMQPKNRPSGVRAAIVAVKSGNADGAKGGRKWDRKRPAYSHTQRISIVPVARTCAAQCLEELEEPSTYAREAHDCHGLSLKAVEPSRAHVPWKSARAERETHDWRAGCGRAARPVRREERRKPMRRSYPYQDLADIQTGLGQRGSVLECGSPLPLCCSADVANPLEPSRATPNPTRKSARGGAFESEGQLFQFFWAESPVAQSAGLQPCVNLIGANAA